MWTVENKRSNDRLLFIGISILILFGLLMVYSASFVAAVNKGTPSYYFIRQSGYAAIGYLLMLLMMFTDYHLWLRPKVIILLSMLSITSLVVVLASAPLIKGARRAMKFGSFFSFQPSEIAKLVVLIFLALFLEKHQPEMKKPGMPLLQCLGFVGLFAALIGLEPDLGQAVCICTIAMILFFIAGLDWKYISTAILSSAPAFYIFVWEVPFRRARILAWLAALRDPLSADYHIRQAAIAVVRGGLFGVGFGESRQKFLYLPEAIGDFIYAIICEELGLIGALLVAAAFLFFLYLGLKISIRARDRSGFYLGLGITLMLCLQAFINISTALAIVPTKGLTLPFISQGGSSLVGSLMAAGILLNISSQRKEREFDEQQD
jgi:cell division protein FtsW